METEGICTPEAPDTKPRPARADWERHHQAITKAVVAGLDGDGMPSMSELVTATGLSENTIRSHLATLKAESAARFEKFKMGTAEVLKGMYKAGKKGDARAAKLYLQFVEDWEERKRVTTRSESPFSDLSDEELDRKLAEMEGKPAAAPAPSPAPAPIESPNGPAA